MIQGTFHAMGTEVAVVAPETRTLPAVELVFGVVESICSRFLPASELSLINESTDTSVTLSPLLAEVMSWAQELKARTSGIVDPGVGGSVRAWGYDRTFAEVGGVESAPSRRNAPDWSLNDGVLDRDPDLELDLGGIAKGWTCDLAIEMTHAVVVNAGGDLRSMDPDLVVSLKDPWGDRVADVKVGDGALATSTVALRAWRVGDRWANHLIDPRTQEPSDSPVLSATALADSAVEAEAAAKTVLLLGGEGLAWASRQDWVRGAIVLWRDLRVYATKGLEFAA